MIACYVRVSTVGQNEQGQCRETTKWLEGNAKDTEAVEWFVDKASGTTLDRPEFERLQKAVFNGEVTAIVVWRLDRLSRSMRDGINVLCDWCDKGIRVVSVSQQIDFNGTMGKMLAAMLLGIAEMEQETRKERQAAGIAAARARGVYFGRQRTTTKGKPARARTLRNKGLSAAEIANALGVSRYTVYRYLK
jgi:DNA invertase Pin-like site-specific DNA recombinase